MSLETDFRLPKSHTTWKRISGRMNHRVNTWTKTGSGIKSVFYFLIHKVYKGILAVDSKAFQHEFHSFEILWICQLHLEGLVASCSLAIHSGSLSIHKVYKVSQTVEAKAFRQEIQSSEFWWITGGLKNETHQLSRKKDTNYLMNIHILNKHGKKSRGSGLPQVTNCHSSFFHRLWQRISFQFTKCTMYLHALIRLHFIVNFELAKSSEFSSIIQREAWKNHGSGSPEILIFRRVPRVSRIYGSGLRTYIGHTHLEYGAAAPPKMKFMETQPVEKLPCGKTHDSTLFHNVIPLVYRWYDTWYTSGMSLGIPLVHRLGDIRYTVGMSCGIPLVCHLVYHVVDIWYTNWETSGIPLVSIWYTVGIPSSEALENTVVYHWYTNRETSGIPLVWRLVYHWYVTW